ncbi:MAG TPA: YcxB family protein [Terriglobia bacterium]|nr:YcxB family protein [Terriglobia bacterium]
MEITYTISREDYWQFRKYYLLRRRSMQATAVIAFLLLGLYVVLVEWILNTSTLMMEISAPLIAAVVMILLVSRFKHVVMSIPSDKGRTLGEHYLSVAPEGVVDRTKSSDRLTRWSGILNIVGNKHYIFLFSDTDQAHIVPKRTFQSKDDAQKFLDAALAQWKADRMAAQDKVDRYGYRVSP